jgi:PAS domain S-box-containing protein
MIAAKLRILHLEDSPEDAELIQATLAAEGVEGGVTHVTNRKDFLEALEHGEFDLILADHGLPSFDGTVALQMTLEKRPEVPFIFVTGSMGEEKAIETFRQGATDYVLKDRLSRLVPAIRRAIAAATETALRKRAEEALRESEERYRRFFEEDLTGDFIATSNGFILACNPAFARIFGYAPVDHALGINFFNLFPSAADKNEFLRQFKEKRRLENFEQVLIGQAGNKVFVIGNILGDFDSTGELTQIIGYVFDNTQRKEAEESRRQLAAILENTPDFVGTFSVTGLALYINQGGRRMIGIGSHEDISLLGLADIHPAPVATRIINEGVPIAVREGVWSAETALLSHPGREIAVSQMILAHKSPKGELEFLSTVMRDITERRQAEKRIREQAALLDKAQDAIIVRDLDQRIIYWNDGATRLYGWSAEEALGRRADELLNKQSSPQNRETARIADENGEWQGELSHLTKAGHEVVVISRRTLLRDDEGKAYATLNISTDITEKKRIEAQYLRAQRLESIGTLAGGIAHDLNNVLAPIVMAIQLLKIKTWEAEDIKLLEALESSAQRGADMVKQILSFARGAPGERVALQLKHLLADMIKVAEKTFPRSIEIQTQVAPNLWTTRGDATQLYQVLMNLCVNARDAMPNGGLLEVRIDNIRLDENYAMMNSEAKVGRYIIIAVRDTGTGIPPQILEKIFDPFFTTKDVGKGSGLGLSTVMGIVKAHGGFVSVYSEVSKGTLFKIYLPAAEAEERENVEREVPKLLQGGGEVVLVVDDERTIREITKGTLENYGYHVMTANDGTEAVSIYAQYTKEIDVVITDMAMPFMDGTATIHALQRMNPAVKIIAVSGLMASSKVAEAAVAGTLSFLQKPFTAEKLLLALHGILKGAGNGRGSAGQMGYKS